MQFWIKESQSFLEHMQLNLYTKFVLQKTPNETIFVTFLQTTHEQNMNLIVIISQTEGTVAF